jgi:hypothetical protein
MYDILISLLSPDHRVLAEDSSLFSFVEIMDSPFICNWSFYLGFN